MSSKPVILHVAGARPNFMKVAPILRELRRRDRTENILLHSGQHYGSDMSDSFFVDLGIPEPDIHLGVGSGTHAETTARVMMGVEEILLGRTIDLVSVVGDVNSTVAAALAAVKLGIPVSHVEAGLRSGDRRMPEEINRILTDQLSALCLTPSRDAHEHLHREGIEEDRIRFVGNVMIDSLLYRKGQLGTDAHPAPELDAGSYVVVTSHRPSNVDHEEQLSEILAALVDIAERVPVLFPIHPRTAKSMERFGLAAPGVRMLPPLGYDSMLALQASAGLMITDSGGIQEETTVLGVPCLTIRENSERPITISEGTNRLVPERTRAAIVSAFDETWGSEVEACRPEGWDGRAAERIADTYEGFTGA